MSRPSSLHHKPCPLLNVEEAVRQLRASGSKVTPQRIAILEVFEHYSSHMTAQHMFEKLSGAEPSLSRATVYNTLDLFAQVGIVSRHQSDEGVIYYDANTTPHHHAVCARCGHVSDVHVPQALMQQLLHLSPEGKEDEGTMQTASIWFKRECTGCVQTSKADTSDISGDL